MSGAAPPDLNRATIVPFIAAVFARCGDREYLGEAVSMSQHMLQGAALAERGGMDEVVIGAALLHDIGHFTGEFGCYTPEDTVDRCHEDSGAALLAPFFPAVVVDCVRHHVAAKRYLCATRADYVEQLSPASRHSLSLQGGAMSAAQLRDFERQPHLAAILQVRLLDEAGKDPAMLTPPFAHYAPLLQRLVDSHCGALGDSPG